MNKCTLHKPQQDTQKHQQKQAQNYQNQQKPKIINISQKDCSWCGAKGHQVEVCHRSWNQACHACGKLGHFTNMCTTRKRYPTNNNQQKKQTNQTIFAQKIRKTIMSELW